MLCNSGWDDLIGMPLSSSFIARDPGHDRHSHRNSPYWSELRSPWNLPTIFRQSSTLRVLRRERGPTVHLCMATSFSSSRFPGSALGLNLDPRICSSFEFQLDELYLEPRGNENHKYLYVHNTQLCIKQFHSARRSIYREA